jgi:hypothetical protein
MLKFIGAMCALVGIGLLLYSTRGSLFVLAEGLAQVFAVVLLLGGFAAWVWGMMGS